MTPEQPPDERPEAELAETEATQDSEVLQREGVEQDLMQKDESPVGEEIDDVEDE
jgi:hypothetical protein